MSVVIWKDGERSLCQPHELHYQLEAGYSLTKDPVEETEDSTENPKDDEEADNSDDVQDENTEGSGDDESKPEVSEEDTRALAKSLKIRNWHNMKLEKLLLKIEEVQDAGQD